jgi:hypothetical protein
MEILILLGVIMTAPFWLPIAYLAARVVARLSVAGLFVIGAVALLAAFL